jgi:hypothetical protein
MVSKIPENRSFNATVLLFEKNTSFASKPVLYRYRITLFYNPYQATLCWWNKELLLSYKIPNDYLLIK